MGFAPKSNARRELARGGIFQVFLARCRQRIFPALCSLRGLHGTVAYLAQPLQTDNDTTPFTSLCKRRQATIRELINVLDNVLGMAESSDFDCIVDHDREYPTMTLSLIPNSKFSNIGLRN